MAVSVFPFANPVAFHLVKISGNFGSAVNETRFVGSSHWKIPRKGGKSKKVGPLTRLERSERNFTFHLHVSRSLYQFQVHGKKICHGQFAKQNGFPRAFTHEPVHSLFFCCPLQTTRGGWKTLQRSRSSTKHSARKPLLKTTNSCPVPGFGICLVHG